MLGPDRPENLDTRTASGEKGAAQRVLLLVLLLVVVLFGYLYFFTGVVKPREDVAPPTVAPIARKPIPPRPGEQASDAVDKAPEKAEKSTSDAVTKGAPSSVEKNAAAPAETKGPVQKMPPTPNASVADKAPAPAVKAVPKALPEQKAVKQAPVPEKKVKQAEAPKGEKVPLKPAATKPAARYALSAGEFILDENLKRTQRQLKKIGIDTFTVSTRMKSEPMHRVHMGDFSSRAEADAELKKVQKAAKAAFVLPIGEKYSLYAGSFFNASQAAKEKERLSNLAAYSQAVTVQAVNVTVPVKRLVAGAYPDKASAAVAAERVKKAGIAAAIVPLQKAFR